MPEARKAITDKGDVPVALTVEPGGAEYAQPQNVWHQSGDAIAEPDAEGRILRDTGNLICTQTTLVSSTGNEDKVVRVHIDFHPDAAKKAHWKNEAGNFEFWLNPPIGWTSDSQYHTIPNTGNQVSNEIWRIEFELKRNDNQEHLTGIIPAYALYNICEDIDGVCLYRRQDISINIREN